MDIASTALRITQAMPDKPANAAEISRGNLELGKVIVNGSAVSCPLYVGLFGQVCFRVGLLSGELRRNAGAERNTTFAEHLTSSRHAFLMFVIFV
jgi:hypothetical protein